MADKTTTGLDPATLPLGGTELFYAIQGGNSRKVAGSEIVKIAHNQAWSTITETPTTLSGYGITDAATAAQGASADSAVQPGDLATVATTGAYADLSGKPTLGTAAATAATDYATAGQGATADSALQPASIGVSVQGHGATLDSLEALSLVSGDVLYATGPDTLARLAKGADGTVLKLASGVPSWGTVAGSGDVVGPSSATDGNVPLFDGTTGKLLKNGRAIQTSATDTTANSLMAVGAFGLGKSLTLTGTIYATGKPSDLYGTGTVTGLGNGGVLGIPGVSSSGTGSGVFTSEFPYTAASGKTALFQTFEQDSGLKWRRSVVDDNTWSAWKQISPALTANTMLVDNAAGTAREAKTAPNVRAFLGVPAFTDMPWFFAAQYGVKGDGTDQTAAFQNFIDNVVPATGGVIILPAGFIIITAQLNFTGRKNLNFEGQGVDQTYIRYTGVGGAGFRAIFCDQCLHVNWRRVAFYATNTSFTGNLMSYGKAVPAGGGSAYNTIDQCAFSTFSTLTGSVLLYLNEVMLFTMRDTSFQWGNGTAIQFPMDNVGYATVVTIERCQFGSIGNGYPISGVVTGCNVFNNNFQATPDGRSRVWTTPAEALWQSISFIGNTFYDVLTGGYEAVVLQWGRGLVVQGNMCGGKAGGYTFSLGGGGISNADPEVRGVTGVTIQGNFYTANVGNSYLVQLNGLKADKTNVRGVVIKGNSVINGFVLGSYNESENLEAGPNNMYGKPLTAVGATPMYHDYPTYVDRAAAITAGLLVGQVFIATGVAGHRQIEVV